MMKTLILLFLFPLSILAKQNDAQKVKAWADYYASYYRLPPIIFYKIIESESPWLHYRPDTLVHYRANKQYGDDSTSFGPMQIKLKVALWLWPDRKVTKRRLLNDIQFNIDSGGRILEMEYMHFRGRTKSLRQAWLMAITAYNLGRGTAIKLGHPSKYAKRVMQGIKV